MSYERAVLITNPKSSRADRVTAEVIRPLDAAGIPFTELRTRSPSSTDNISDIADAIQPGDRIVVASGDGVSNQAANAVLETGYEDVSLAMLPYGGFNDMATTFNGTSPFDPLHLFDKSADVRPVSPLDIHVNDEHLRHAVLYSTLGWTGLASAVMDSPEIRSEIQASRLKQPRMILEATKLYLKSRKDSVLPDFDINGTPYSGMTDIAFMNGPKMAQVTATGQDLYATDSFHMVELNVGSLVKNVRFLGLGVLNAIARTSFTLPGRDVESANVNFSEPASFALQTDGEVHRIENVRTLNVIKKIGALDVVHARVA